MASSDYAKPSVTVDVVIITLRGAELQVLLVKRDIAPYKGRWAIPGGFVHLDESLESAAQRELREETGYEAPVWIDLGHYLVDPNRGVANGYLFLARGARRVAEPASDDLEEQRLLHLTREEIEYALANGEFKVLAWAAAVAFALKQDSF